MTNTIFPNESQKDLSLSVEGGHRQRNGIVQYCGAKKKEKFSEASEKSSSQKVAKTFFPIKFYKISFQPHLSWFSVQVQTLPNKGSLSGLIIEFFLFI